MSVPTPDDSFVFVNLEDDTKAGNSSNILTAMEVEPRPPEMKSMHVVSNVRNRYARTVVTSKYTNPELSAQQATFSIVLPDTAFIAGFVMEIKGKKYEAYVREKEEAKQEYQAAVSRGQAAAHVAVSARDSNKFTVSVNVQPQSDVTFTLTYEELLVRKHSKYELLVNLHLAQLLDDLAVDIHINESRPIVNLQTPALRSGNEITEKFTKNNYATIEKCTDEVVHVSFHPTVQQQKEMTNALSSESNSNGISGQFVVEYDVERDPLGGEVLVNDGYFVHFFAPTELKPIPKHVVFVLDVSGSMHGRKIEQLKEAMKVILSELNSEDYFNIIKFESCVQILYNNNSLQEANASLPATAENIQKAQTVVGSMQAGGGTNISDALITALSVTSKGITTPGKNTNIQPIIVFLTDGQANVGESNPSRIIEMVLKLNDSENKSAIFTLAFGNDANKEFLKELAMKNSGFLRNIYEAADASLQLQDFYKQISSPLLTNVNFKYSEEVKEVTKHKFDILFNGSEFVVTGKLDKVVDGFVIVEGSTLNGIGNFRPTIIPICPTKETKENYGNLERLWAYMTIKQLLDRKYEKKYQDKYTSNSETPEQQALKLSLKYSFVTPLTSLVVVKPEETKEDDLQWGSVHVTPSQVSGRPRALGLRCAAPSIPFPGLRGVPAATTFGSSSNSQPFGFGAGLRYKSECFSNSQSTTFNSGSNSQPSGFSVGPQPPPLPIFGSSCNFQPSGCSVGPLVPPPPPTFGSSSNSQPFGLTAGSPRATTFSFGSNSQPSSFGVGPSTGTIFGSSSNAQPSGFGTRSPGASVLSFGSNSQPTGITFGSSSNSQPSGFGTRSPGATTLSFGSYSQPSGFGLPAVPTFASISNSQPSGFAAEPPGASKFSFGSNSQQSGFAVSQPPATTFGSSSNTQPSGFPVEPQKPTSFSFGCNAQPFGQPEAAIFGLSSISQPCGTTFGSSPNVSASPSTFVTQCPLTSNSSQNEQQGTMLQNVVAAPNSPELKSMHVVSNVRNRYGRTVLTSKYANQDARALQTTFSFVLPKTAFITGFVMEIKGAKYEANMRKREQAKREFQEAVAQGLAAAHVKDNADNSNKFTVSVNIEAQSEVTFILTYEQLLVQKNRKYEIVTYLYPVEVLEVNVKINDDIPIENVETAMSGSKNQILRNQYATINKNIDGSIHVSFKPTADQQKEIINTLKESNENNGISGWFVVEFKIETELEDTEISVTDSPVAASTIDLIVIKLN